MARWLQSAGLQHLAAPLAGGGPATVGPGSGSDPRAGVLPSLLLQGYGPQTIEEKQKLYTLLRSLNFNGESGGVGTGTGTASEPYIPTTNPSFGGTSSAVDNNSFYSPELKGEFGAGLLDLHAVDDTELLSEHVMPEQFEPSPVMPKGMDDEDDTMFGGLPGTGDGTGSMTTGEKEILKETSNVAKIKVVVRKRPLNKKEISRKEDDIVDVRDDSYLTVYEPKLKVDLTAYVEKHEFCFDAVLDEDVSNDEVYRETVEPIIPTIFERTKATCFAYGQTGSGKTYTMQPLPLRAAHDMVRLLHQPYYRNQNFKLWLSFFEIYGGKLFDLLCDRRKLLMREDGRQQVCIVGLQEFEVSDVQIVKDYIEKGNASRSTGSTGANEESSRSHAILQLAIKKHRDPTAEINLRSRKMTDPNDPKNGKVVGKISFIDLAGSERGADTTDNDRQTRIEGAEINKSLLALKECIRALDNDQLHIPFRGSKLTEVLRDSFVGNSRTVMISCISPNAGSCEHTLNTLRYADRVKSLSKSGNPKKDSGTASVIPSGKDTATGLLSDDPFDPVPLPIQDFKPPEMPKRDAESFPNFPSSSTQEPERTSFSMIPSYTGIATRERREERERRDEKGASTSSMAERERFVEGRGSRPQQVQSTVDRERVIESRSSKPQQAQNLVERERVETRSKLQPVQNSIERDNAEEEKVPKVSPPRRKGYNREERIDRQSNLPKRDNGAGPGPESVRAGVGGKQSHIMQKQFQEKEVPADDGDLNAILEEEEALIAAHRKEIENTMEIVREEMNLLAEVDQPGSLIDSYVTQLSFLLSRKAAGLVSLQARLARFQHRLKEQEILSRKKPSHR